MDKCWEKSLILVQSNCTEVLVNEIVNDIFFKYTCLLKIHLTSVL